MPHKDHPYRIVKWWDRHSSAEQRRLGGRAILCPTSFDSLGYRMLVADLRGVQAFGVYVALAELAGKLPTRYAERTAGILANDQGALGVPALSLLVGMPQKVVGAALDRLQANEIGWIDRVPLPAFEPEPPGDIPEVHREPPGVEPDPPRVRARGSSSSSKPASYPDALAAAAAGVLERAGVPRGRIAQIIASQPDLTPSVIVAHWYDVRQDPKVNRHGGALASRFSGSWDGTPKLTPRAVYEAVRAGVIRNVAGEKVDASRVSQNSQGFYLDGSLLVPTPEIESVVLL